MPRSGRYRVSEYGGAYIDGNTGEQVQVKNVLILRTDVSAIKGDDKGRQSVRTTGTGSGQLFCDGRVQEITWSRSGDSSPMTYLDAAGNPCAWALGRLTSTRGPLRRRHRGLTAALPKSHADFARFSPSPACKPRGRGL